MVVKMDFCVNIGFYGNYLFIVLCNGLVLLLLLYLCDNVDFQVIIYYSNICLNGVYQGYGVLKGNFVIIMVLVELVEQLQID